MIKWIAIVLIAVLSFNQPASDYVNSSGKAKAAETKTNPSEIQAEVQTVQEEAELDDISDEEELSLPENLVYVSDVRLFHAQDKDKAKNACKKAGYTLVDADLNRGTKKDAWEDFWSDEGDGAYVYLGYKTTSNRDEAITSMKMGEMETGYQSFNYDEIEANMNTGMNILAEDILVAVSETKKNMENGDIYAGKVKESLNMFYVPYMNNRGLGDVIFDAKDVGVIARMLKRSSSVVVVNIFSYLTMGVSGSNVSGLKGNLAERIANASQKIDGMAKSEYVTLDSLYKDDVKQIRDSLKSFADIIEPSIKAYQDAGGTLSDSFIDNHTEDALNIQAYNKLNQYTMADGTGIGTYLYRLGTSTLKSKEDIRKAYPLVMAMSPGQLTMFPYTGVIDTANYLEKSSEALAAGDALMAEVRQKIKDCGLEETKDGRIPIYPGDKDTLYRAQVAMTSEAIRAASARDEYHKLTQYDKDSATWDKVMTWGNRVLVFAMAGHFLGRTAVWAMGKMGLKWMFKTVVGRSFSTIGVPLRIAGSIWTFVVFIVVMLVWYGINKLKDTNSYYNPDMKEVPRYMYSVEKVKGKTGKKESVYVLYTPVYNVNANSEVKSLPEYQEYNYKDSSSELAKKKKNNEKLISDFNAKQGKKWNALYVSKDPKAGSPICGEEIDDIFLVKQGEYNSSISGYQAYSSFGNENAVNLNSNQYSDSIGGIYLYYRTEDTLKDPEGISFKTDGKYVSDVVLICEKKEKDAKAAIKLKQGKYQFLDQNLTPNQNCFTFLGYATTENINDAIRDLRVDPVNTGNSMGGGYRRNNIGYASVGSTIPTDKGHSITLYQTAVNKGETDVSKNVLSKGESLTKDDVDENNTVMSYSGAPILADFKVVDSIDKAPVGYEPIISGCGGAAFNFNTCYEKDNDKKKRYVYFQPAVSFVKSGTEVKTKKGVTYVTSDEEYVAGVQAFLLGGKKKGRADKLKKRIKSMGYTVFDADLLNKYIDREDGSNSSLTCYLGYATTCNPFRAIGDIRYYKGTPYAKTMQYSASTTEGSFIGMDCNVFGQGINPGKAYCGASDYLLFEGFGRNHNGYYTDTGERADSWQEISKYNFYAERELYILGADEEHPALKASDIQVSRYPSAPAGMRSISYMTDKCSRINYDISCAQDCVHFYIKKPAEEKKKYISGIYVSTFKMGKDMSDIDKWMAIKNADDSTMLSACAASDGEVIPTNIAVKPENAWNKILEVNIEVKAGGEKEQYNSHLVRGFTIYKHVRTRTTNYDTTKKPEITIPKEARKYSYIGVTRTDDPEEALTGIIRYKFSGSTPPNRISIGGVKYYKAGDAVGDICLYTTTSENAMPGLPITDISFDQTLALGGSGTLLSTDKTDPDNLQQQLDAIDANDDLDDFEKILKKAELRRSVVKLNCEYHNKLSGHLYVDTTDSFITDIIIGRGKNEKEAVENTINGGASYIYSFNTNLGIGNSKSAEGHKKGLQFGTDSMDPTKQNKVSYDYICIGYNSESTWSGGDLTYGVHDILITAGKPFQKNGFKKYGCEYIPVSDINLNSSTDGEELYMYYTFDESDKAASPIASLALAKGDSMPGGIGEYRYEYIMTDTGKKANLNLGATAVKDEVLLDTRLWLFANRYDNTVKSEALFDITDSGRKTTRMDVEIQP
ncbi:MAG: hypothetical protein K6G65_10575 [Lachnospiraceae bacterium]|nr:hypothetical protein [Lachnospiraceae bacterium]